MLGRREIGGALEFAGGGEGLGGGGIGGEIGPEFAETAGEGGALGGGGGSGRGQSESVVEARVVVGGGSSENALRHHAGGFDVSGIVEGDEGVKRGVGAAIFHAANLAGTDVEERGGADNAAPKHIEAAAVESVALVLQIALLAERGFFPDAGGLVGFDTGAAHFFDEQTGGGEGLIAQHPRGEAMARAAGEQAVLGVALMSGGGGAGGLAVGGAGDDEAVHGLQVPTAGDKLGGEPIEQFRVRGMLGLDAEIFGGFHEAGAEIGLPHAVHFGPCGEGIAGGDEPVREIEAVHAPGRSVGGRAENLGDMAFDADVGLGLVVAAGKDDRVTELLDLVHDHDLRD